MCGGRRAGVFGVAAPSYPKGFDLSYDSGYGYPSPAPCGHRAGCSRPRCGHTYGPSYGYGYGCSQGRGVAAPLLGAAIDMIGNAINERSNARAASRLNGVAHTYPVIGSNAPNAPPRYQSDSTANMENVRTLEKRTEAALDEKIEEPPPYTPHATTRPDQQAGVHNAPAPDNAPLDSKVQRLNADFSALPILQFRTSTIDQDITKLSNAIASIRLGECGSKCAARRAGKQLVRDIWAAEEIRWAGRGSGCGGRMGGQEKRLVKGQIKELKQVIKAEVKATRV